MMVLIEQGFTEKQIVEEFSTRTINNYFTYLSEKSKSVNSSNGRRKITSRQGNRVIAKAKTAF